MGDPSYWQPERFLLWIDGVGGYLICLKDTISLGHASGGPEVDVPILAAISHAHARICRDGEGYLLEPIQQVWVDGRQVQKGTWLRDGSRIQLGLSLHLKFRVPHPFSATARLEFLSSHRTEPRTDAVVLMAETCLLGRQSNCHIVCPQREKPVVFFRYQGALYCRTEGWLEVEGKTYQERTGPLSANSRLRADHLCLGIEAF